MLHRRMSRCGILGVVGGLLVGSLWTPHLRAAELIIAENGRPLLPIITGSAREPAEHLKRTLERMVGAEFHEAEGGPGQAGIYVGLESDFDWVKLPESERLGPDGVLLKTDEKHVYLIGRSVHAVENAVATFLRRLGCRWFFPGAAWEILPQSPTIAGSWNEVHSPSFPTQRRIWYGYGSYAPCLEEQRAWSRHNRIGGPIEIQLGHTWIGLNPEQDFDQHPEWFALVDGKRQPSKPCYSHPEVIDKAVAVALQKAAAGEQVVSVTPPDGLGYCECPRCLATAGVSEVVEDQSTAFGKRHDGTLVSVASETVFAMVNRVAEAVSSKHPETLVGCYAYSAYSHPPSFAMHPNAYLQTTTAYRRTSLTMDEQLRQFGEKTKQLGIREYYSVYQWDWDYPDPGKLTPGQLQKDLSFFHEHGVTAINAEASNNWAARGPGYYVAAQLMWDVDQDVCALMRDFYEQAFGPAAKAMERYYVRWGGPELAALTSVDALPEKQQYFENGKHNLDALRAAFQDLDEAARQVRDSEPHRIRVDRIRMYLHYLLLRWKVEQAAASGSEAALLQAIRQETEFGGRLTYTNMIHTRPLLGKAFPRRFREYADALGDLQQTELWRTIGDPPGPEELDQLWEADKRQL